MSGSVRASVTWKYSVRQAIFSSMPSGSPSQLMLAVVTAMQPACE